MFEATFVSLMRGVRTCGQRAGLVSYLDRHLANRTSLYLRSLLAIHDVKDMSRLDVPWWSFSAIDRIQTFLQTREGNTRAFEYGPGASTFWLARRCQSVAFVEHDLAWWKTFEPLVAELSNVAGVLKAPRRLSNGERASSGSGRSGWEEFDFNNYVHAIETMQGPFDLIVIDGRARSAYLPVAEQILAPDGIIIFDNSNRRRYQNALEMSHLAKERYRGLTPASPYPTETTVLGPAAIK